MAKIRIKLPNQEFNPVEIPITAQKVGKFFAVHPDVRWRRRTNRETNYLKPPMFSDTGYTVTHVPTGTAVVQSVKFRRKAMRCATMLEAVQEIPWELTRPRAFKGLRKKLPKSVMVALRDVMATVKS